MPEDAARRLHADAAPDQGRHERPDLGLITRRPDGVPRDAQHDQHRHDPEIRRHPIQEVPEVEPPKDHGRRERRESDQRENPVKRARPGHRDREQHRPRPQKERRPEGAGRERGPRVPSQKRRPQQRTPAVQERPQGATRRRCVSFCYRGTASRLA